MTKTLQFGDNWVTQFFAGSPQPVHIHNGRQGRQRENWSTTAHCNTKTFDRGGTCPDVAMRRMLDFFKLVFAAPQTQRFAIAQLHQPAGVRPAGGKLVCNRLG